MSIAKSRLTTRGQISVPAEVRRKLGIGPGSIIEWQQVGDQMVVRRAGTFSSGEVHRALFPLAPVTPTLHELKQVRGEYVRKKHARG